MNAVIATLHYNHNCGAVAQALCMSKHFDAPVLDFTYRTRRRWIDAHAKRASQKSTLRFCQDSLWLTPPFSTEREAIDFINSKDVLIVGSDEVLRSRPRRIADPPFPNIYYGSKISIPKILYAACSNPDFRMQRRHIELLDRFDWISVRDSFTLDQIRRLSRQVANRTQVLPDPTFAVEFFDPPTASLDEEVHADYGPFPTLLERPLNPVEWFREIASYVQVETARYHGLIACLLGNTLPKVSDARPKTQELARQFQITNWNPGFIRKKVLEYRHDHCKARASLLALFDINWGHGDCHTAENR